jgi:predicted ATPase
VACGGQILLSQETAELVRRTLPDGVTLKDMGEHRLKGMQWLEHLYQVCAPELPSSFPQLATAIIHPMHNLPIQLTSFIGREKEIAQVIDRLGKHRLVTLTGSGGTGKTRLSLKVAEELSGSYPDGIWFVELAPLADPGMVPQAVFSALGLQETPGRSLFDALLDFLRPKRLLLILDNCEHLVEASAGLAANLLHTCPDLTILASSREILGVEGEAPFRVPPLYMPDAGHIPALGELPEYDAVRLFIERARVVSPGFTITGDNVAAVIQVVNRLDGIPLAIELATARLGLLSVSQIAMRLNDAFRLLTGGSRTVLPRHQTLRALIDWSYGLLSEEERVLFRRLSVFRSGWMLEAAEMVCPCGEGDAIDVLDQLAGLVNKSLIQSVSGADGTNRFHMLETMRQYAQEKLVEAGEAVHMRDRHLVYFVTLAEALEKNLHSPAYLEALEQQDVEIDNYRIALGWALEVGGSSIPGGSSTASQNPRAVDGLRLANALADYMEMRNLFFEGYAWLEKGLARVGDTLPLLSLRARAYFQLAHHFIFSELKMQHLYSQSVALYRKSDDQFGLALALIQYGSMLSDIKPDYPRSLDSAAGIALIAEGITIFEQLGDPRSLGWAYCGKANIAERQKDYGTQLRMMAKCIACFEGDGDILTGERLKLSNAWVIFSPGRVLWETDFDTVQTLLEQSLEFSGKIKSKWWIYSLLSSLGLIVYFQGDYPQAETCYREALSLSREKDDIAQIVWCTRMLGGILARQGDIPRARQLFLESQSLGRKIKYGDLYGDPSGDLAFILWMGGLAEILKRFELAARFLGAVEAILETFFTPLRGHDQWEYERITSLVRARLDETTFTTAWTEGRKLTLEQALEEALAFCREGERVS